MRIGITADVMTKHFSMEAGIETLADLGFDALDFPLNIYSIRNFPEGSIHRVMYTDDWRSFACRVRDTLKANHITAYQVHAHWGLYTDMAAYIPPEEQFRRQIEACSIIGSRYLVFHPIPPTVRMNSVADRDAVVDYNVRWFRELVPYAEAYGVHLTLENTFSHEKHVPRDGLFPFVDAETMNQLADGIGSPNVSFCLDVGHANVELGDQLPNMVRELGKRLKVIHLHDNFGRLEPLLRSDLHMFPGYGMADIEAVCRALGEINFEGVLSMEPSHRNMPKERLLRVLEHIIPVARYYGDIVDANRPQG